LVSKINAIDKILEIITEENKAPECSKKPYKQELDYRRFLILSNVLLKIRNRTLVLITDYFNTQAALGCCLHSEINGISADLKCPRV